MERTNETPCYLSKVTPLPAAVAPELFDRWCGRRANSTGTSTVVMVPDGELVVDDSSLERYSAPELVLPYRRLRGRLQFRSAWARTVDVEVELAPWSKTHSELAIRYSGRRRSGPRRRERFHTLGTDALDVLSASLVWLRTRPDELDEPVIVAA